MYSREPGIFQVTKRQESQMSTQAKKYFAEVELRFSMETIGVKSEKFSTGTGCSANLD
jgi:hypothetical protein